MTFLLVEWEMSLFCRGKSRLLLRLPHPSTRRWDGSAGEGGHSGTHLCGRERHAAIFPPLQRRWEEMFSFSVFKEIQIIKKYICYLGKCMTSLCFSVSRLSIKWAPPCSYNMFCSVEILLSCTLTVYETTCFLKFLKSKHA